MRLGLLTQWYDPEPGPAALPGALARALAARGHDVRVLTGFPNYPTGALPTGWRMRRRLERVEDGVRVTRVALYPSHDASTARRMANYGSFGASALLNGVGALRGLDALWVNYSPITIAPAMFAARYGFGVPLVCHIGDLWPDTLTAGGFAPGHPRVRGAVEAVLDRWCSAMYAASEKVTYIAPGARSVLSERGVPDHKLEFAPMWADEEVFRPADERTRAAGEAWRVELGIAADDVLLLYAGAIGHAQGLHTLLEAAAHLDRSRLRVVVAGSGVAQDELSERAASVPHVQFVGRVPQEQMGVLMAAADACYIGLATTPLSRITMPSKTQATFAAGRPVVVAADGDVQRVVADAGAGWGCDSGDVAGLTGALRRLCDSGRGGSAARGQAARTYYETHFSLAAATDRAQTHLREAAAAGRRRRRR